MSKLIERDPKAFAAVAANKKDLKAWRQTAESQKDMHTVKSYNICRRGKQVVFNQPTLRHDPAMKRESHARKTLPWSGQIC